MYHINITPGPGIMLSNYKSNERLKQTSQFSDQSLSLREKNYQNLIFELSIQFINLPLDQVSSAMNYALEKVAEFFLADRAYVFDYDFQNSTTSNIYEWCSEGVHPQIDELKDVPLELIPDWVNIHLEGKPLIIDDVASLPDGALKEILLPQLIKSLIAYPLMYEDQCLGFVGLDSVRQHTIYGEFEVQLLSLFSALLVSLKNREKNTKQVLQAASVFEHAYEGIIITDPLGRIENVNDAFEQITGLSKLQAISHYLYDLPWTTDLEMEKSVIWASLTNLGFWSGEVKKRRSDGSEYILQLNISSVKQDDGKVLHYVALLTEVVELNRLQNKIKLTSHYDPLTQLPNRLMLTEQLGTAIALAQDNTSIVAVIYIDLDDFKAINEKHSHAAGNELLLHITKRLKKVIGDKDVLARIGGDEFVVVVNQVFSKNDVKTVVKKIVEQLTKPMRLETNMADVQVAASIGVSVYPQKDEVDPDQLIRQADQAMFLAKQLGKNRVQFFDFELDSSIRGRYQNIARIKTGLSNEEFELYYQPKVNMRRGHVYGLEALIRWNHPTQGILRPDHFLPILDGHVFSINIGEWVISKALEQIEELSRFGIRVPISVNIDAIHIQQPDFVESLKRQLTSHPNVDPALLELEVLERAALSDIVQVSKVIDECKQLGVSVALDDFGTGYSSLTYLKRLKANTLKIDKSFVRDMLTDPDDLAILEGVIGLAAAFQRKVVAEGVETAFHIKMLLLLGCEIGQGYAFSKPMPASELVSWIKNWNTSHQAVDLVPVGNEKLPILYAIVEHRAWVKRVKLFVQDFIEAPPPLDCHQCNFGQWLDRPDGGHQFSGEKAYESLLQRHAGVHELALEMIHLKNSGHVDKAIQRFNNLDQLQDLLTNELYELVGQ